MNSYLLYLPNQTNRATALAAVGLSSIAGNERWFESPVTPDNTSGLFCTWGDGRDPAKSVAVVYDPSRQTWRKMPGGYWFGIQNDKRPNPEGLARVNSINGHAIKMGDGNDWVLPNVMALPAVFDLDGDGNEIKRTRDEWQHIEERAGWALDCIGRHFRGEVLPESDCRRYVAEMLAVNYRATVEIVYALGLLDSDCWVGAMAATVDGGRLLAMRQEILSGES